MNYLFSERINISIKRAGRGSEKVWMWQWQHEKKYYEHIHSTGIVGAIRVITAITYLPIAAYTKYIINKNTRVDTIKINIIIIMSAAWRSLLDIDLQLPRLKATYIPRDLICPSCWWTLCDALTDPRSHRSHRHATISNNKYSYNEIDTIVYLKCESYGEDRLRGNHLNCDRKLDT